MLSFRRTLAAVTAVASWSCGSTQPDATPQVAAIVVTPSSSTLALNAQLPLQAQVQDQSGDLIPDVSVTWTVENETIASVSPAGVVTGLALGTTQVAANARGKSGIATVTVTRTPVASVVVRPNTATGAIGSKTQLTATTYDASLNVLTGRAITWTTSNAAVATVDANGLVTAKASGTATITATSEGKSDACQFTVPQVPVASVSVTRGAASIPQNGSTSLTATTKDANGNDLIGRVVTWTITSGTGVVTLSATSGQSVTVTGGLIGSATIVATSETKTGSTSITVAAGTVSSVKVVIADPDGDGKMKLGSQTTVTAQVLDQSGLPLQGRGIDWTVNSAFTLVSSTTTTSTGANSAATATVKAILVSSNATASATETVSRVKGSDGIAVVP